jgi:hydroxymethylglutaryl-CoA synthase
MHIGIDLISFYTSHYYLDLRALAEARGQDYAKYSEGIGQQKMALPPPDEDIVTMAANAALPVVERAGMENLELLLFATESSVDQSKAAALHVHGLLGLPARCRAVELKEACYGATAALQLAAAWVRAHPDKRALVLGSDIARYDLGSPGEATQGCGAVAMLITAAPRVLALEPENGFFAQDTMDFWRPNYRSEALVDGKYSTRVYLHSLTETWNQYARLTGRTTRDFAHFCFHLPFTRIAEKGLERIFQADGRGKPGEAEMQALVRDGLAYNRMTGNSYAACLYQSLACLLDSSARDLSAQRVGFYSYGSGAMAEFFSGIVPPGYREHLFTDAHRALLDTRIELTVRQYEDIFHYGLPEDGGDHVMAPYRTGPFRLAGIKQHKRVYERKDA